MTTRPTFSKMIEHERALYSRLAARRRAVTSLATVPGLQLPRAHEGRSAESARRFLDFEPHEDSPIQIDTARPWTYLTLSRSDALPPGTLPRVPSPAKGPGSGISGISWTVAIGTPVAPASGG